MKKLYFLLLLCAGLSSAQTFTIPALSPLMACDDNSDGFSIFDLSLKTPEVMGNYNPAIYAVNYFETETDADNNVNQLASPYSNTTPTSQQIFVRLTNAQTADFAVAQLLLEAIPLPNATISLSSTVYCEGDIDYITFSGFNSGPPYVFSYTVNGGAVQTIYSEAPIYGMAIPNVAGTYDYELVSVAGGNLVSDTGTYIGCTNPVAGGVNFTVKSTPVAHQAPDLVVAESPNDGLATFDLTSNASAILQGQTGVSLTYHLTETDASSFNNEISNPFSFDNTTNPQTIWVRVNNNSTSCFSVTSFNLAVTDIGEVYIPDANFKAKLIADGVDTNTDGKIQYAEAELITTLSLGSQNIADLTGIKSFTSLEFLDVMENQLTTLDLSGMITLQTVYASNNALTSINNTGMTALVDLGVENNHITSLTAVSLNNLQFLKCLNNNISTVNLIELPALTELNLGGNALTALNVTNLTALQILYLDSNQLASVNVAGLVSLKQLSAEHNQLGAIDVSGLANLEVLYYSYNPNPTVTTSGATGIKYLKLNNCGANALPVAPSSNLLVIECESNAITSLDVSGFPALTNLSCGSNQLATLNVSGLPELIFLSCPANQLTTLDCNSNSHLDMLTIYGNPMETLFVKNGANETFEGASFIENPQLQYICADDFQVAAVQAMAGPSIQVNTYCTTTPGGDYNTITGTVKFDADNNGCDASDSAQPLIKVSVYDGTTLSAVFTDDAAVYSVFTGAGNYNVAPSLENDFFTISPTSATVDFPVVDNSVSTNNFCLTANGVHPDIEIVIAPIVPAKPGFDAVYQVTFKNNGNQVLAATNGVSFSFNDVLANFVTAVPAASTTAAGVVTWDYMNLVPFESRSLMVTLHINAATDEDPVNIGDVLHFTANALPLVNDENPGNNLFQFDQTVVGSFDPNAKTCVEGETVSETEIGEYLHYIINFENTGTAVAENIVVKDVIDTTKFDVSSLQIIGSSNPVSARVNGNIAEFIFHNINLDSGGHGNILLKIKTLNTLVTGDKATNGADIFFDYNFPVATNVAETTFGVLSVNDPKADTSVSIVPNPVSELLTIKAASAINSVQLFDVQGRLLQTRLANTNKLTLDVSGQQTGIYFVKVNSANGTKVQKIMKK
jgi:uncharacterized repeat protein (TIGR01451 family)